MATEHIPQRRCDRCNAKVKADAERAHLSPDGFTTSPREDNYVLQSSPAVADGLSADLCRACLESAHKWWTRPQRTA